MSNNYEVQFVTPESIDLEGGVHEDNNITADDINSFFGVTKEYAKSYSISPKDGTVTIKQDK